LIEVPFVIFFKNGRLAASITNEKLTLWKILTFPGSILEKLLQVLCRMPVADNKKDRHNLPDRGVSVNRFGDHIRSPTRRALRRLRRLRLQPEYFNLISQWIRSRQREESEICDRPSRKYAPPTLTWLSWSDPTVDMPSRKLVRTDEYHQDNRLHAFERLPDSFAEEVHNALRVKVDLANHYLSLEEEEVEAEYELSKNPPGNQVTPAKQRLDESDRLEQPGRPFQSRNETFTSLQPLLRRGARLPGRRLSMVAAAVLGYRNETGYRRAVDKPQHRLSDLGEESEPESPADLRARQRSLAGVRLPVHNPVLPGNTWAQQQQQQQQQDTATAATSDENPFYVERLQREGGNTPVPESVERSRVKKQEATVRWPMNRMQRWRYRPYPMRGAFLGHTPPTELAHTSPPSNIARQRGLIVPSPVQGSGDASSSRQTTIETGGESATEGGPTSGMSLGDYYRQLYSQPQVLDGGSATGGVPSTRQPVIQAVGETAIESGLASGESLRDYCQRLRSQSAAQEEEEEEDIYGVTPPRAQSEDVEVTEPQTNGERSTIWHATDSLKQSEGVHSSPLPGSQVGPGRVFRVPSDIDSSSDEDEEEAAKVIERGSRGEKSTASDTTDRLKQTAGDEKVTADNVVQAGHARSLSIADDAQQTGHGKESVVAADNAGQAEVGGPVAADGGDGQAGRKESLIATDNMQETAAVEDSLMVTDAEKTGQEEHLDADSVQEQAPDETMFVGASSSPQIGQDGSPVTAASFAGSFSGSQQPTIQHGSFSAPNTPYAGENTGPATAAPLTVSPWPPRQPASSPSQSQTDAGSLSSPRPPRSTPRLDLRRRLAQSHLQAQTPTDTLARLPPHPDSEPTRRLSSELQVAANPGFLTPGPQQAPRVGSDNFLRRSDSTFGPRQGANRGTSNSATPGQRTPASTSSPFGAGPRLAQGPSSLVPPAIRQLAEMARTAVDGRAEVAIVQEAGRLVVRFELPDLYAPAFAANYQPPSNPAEPTMGMVEAMDVDQMTSPPPTSATRSSVLDSPLTEMGTPELARLQVSVEAAGGGRGAPQPSQQFGRKRDSDSEMRKSGASASDVEMTDPSPPKPRRSNRLRQQRAAETVTRLPPVKAAIRKTKAARRGSGRATVSRAAIMHRTATGGSEERMDVEMAETAQQEQRPQPPRASPARPQRATQEPAQPKEQPTAGAPKRPLRLGAAMREAIRENMAHGMEVDAAGRNPNAPRTPELTPSPSPPSTPPAGPQETVELPPLRLGGGLRAALGRTAAPAPQANQRLTRAAARRLASAVEEEEGEGK
ncbi:hypothetical protein CP533_5954, partial [Ophiocordyceps camponoti-saundersi (nom. inval.)]